jgi:hypothetical protein
MLCPVLSKEFHPASPPGCIAQAHRSHRMDDHVTPVIDTLFFKIIPAT